MPSHSTGCGLDLAVVSVVVLEVRSVSAVGRHAEEAMLTAK